ncbi:uncharacterized protein F4812DRAFT_52609 [Daldinia caldariorum]|uniref:uncharacterized protein n=1 Tax=Daldinia caldariorum TaxID=326644 RepID=UPI0020077BCC|nr:uncharacterized protein F4812DRAFT_52609 [Daldinia caldariorum]KAI1467186.1 hypothetical protein F4812DRAFT_52609 [Daldinia caldariorum]
MPESIISATDGGLREPPKRRYRRTRTGCERCRAQHRKCDEEKPECRRCTDSGAACKYIARVSFLEKNSRTVVASASSSPSLASAKRGYRALEFVVNTDVSTERRTSNSPLNPMVISHTEQPQGGVDNERLPGPQDAFFTVEPQAQKNESSNHRGREIVSQNSEGIETGDVPCLNHQSLSTESPSSAIGQGNKKWPLVGRSSLSDDEIDLLKYYSHHIAPWLDVYDQSQTFGQLLTQLAMNSPCVLDGILQTSAIFSGRSIERIKRRGVGILYLLALTNPASTETGLLEIRLMANFVLGRTRLFVQDVPETWQPTFYKGGSVFYNHELWLAEANSSQKRIWASCSALLSRLEIAYYLMNQTSPALITNHINRFLILVKKHIGTDGQWQKISHASFQCLELLTGVMDLCLPVSEGENYAASPQAVASPLIGAPEVAKWKELLNALQEWQMHRPQELRQLIEVEGLEATFPIVIFVGSAGISANALYHTAMLLLLSNRPQSISFTELSRDLNLDAAQTSPLWHAHRVCGIALNSEPEHTHCWDPCMIAAFSVAARRITHPTQQNDIIAHLDRVKTAGWNIDGLVRKLREEWGPVR